MLFVASDVAAQQSWAWQVDRRGKRILIRHLRLVVAMALIVAVVAGLAYWDTRREATAALQDSAEKQAALSQALAHMIAVRASDGSSLSPAAIFDVLRKVERQDALTLFIHRPGEDGLRASDGRLVRSSRIAEALQQGTTTVRIPREEAEAFDLPPRTALAGISTIDAGAFRGWAVVATASAERQRDREMRARRRLVLSILTAAGLVLAFGGLALRNQRKELVLERELAVASIQQKRDERLQRASKAAVVGTLAMGIAHEISTPLGVIAARAEQLTPKVEGDERARTSLQAILTQIDHIKGVVRGLLELARGDFPTAERIDPRVIVQHAIDLTEHKFLKAGVWLTPKVDPDLPMVLGDPRLLEQAIVNLLLNACDASKPADRVVVSARNPGSGVEITVEDSGSGISAADLGRAFEPFFTTKPRGEGTGLGLAIAREIVASHRGTLAISARSPCGTSAIIRLPPAEGVKGA
jgi:signal transduction histidine kinase